MGLLYLPTRKADISPIENVFAAIKAMMRTKAERRTPLRSKAVSSTVDLFKPAECTDFRGKQ